MLVVRGKFGVCLMVCLVAGCNGAPQGSIDPPIPRAESLQQPSTAELPPGLPEKFQVKLETTKGDVIIEVNSRWSPNGAQRIYTLVKEGFYDRTKFFRVLDGFMAQIGINGDPAVQSKWRDANIPDDPVVESNKRGFVTFAKSQSPNSRSTQIFINYGDNSQLDRDGFSPFGQVIEGMDVVESLYGEYGEGYPNGSGPNQSRIQDEGNAYLERDFPKLDAIKTATIVSEE